MKQVFLFLMIFVIVKLEAQNYQISFAGSGASTAVDSVQVENLTQCTSISLSGSDILNLNGNVGINEIRNSTDNSLRVYPNPVTDYCFIDFGAIAEGETTISLFDIAGKRIAIVQEFLTKGEQTFKLNGIGSGIYFIKVESNQYSFSAKVVSCIGYQVSSNAEIKQIESLTTTNQNALVANEGEPDIKSLKGNKSYIAMPYTTNDTLKLTGYSGIYSTVFMLVPDSSQTVTFNFIPCTDADSNHYTVVQIGTQIWMEENLKTTKYNNGTLIPNVTDSIVWNNLSTPAFCWYNDSIQYKNIYGGLYNWFAADTNIICPIGWHVPDSAEWKTLVNYLGGKKVAGGKMKEACSKYWNSPNTGATNSSGFTALPGGYRGDWLGMFDQLGIRGDFWSTTKYDAPSAWYCGEQCDERYSYMDYKDDGNKHYGLSVRCVKN